MDQIRPFPPTDFIDQADEEEAIRIVEKDYFLSLVLGLVGINGCSKVEKESKEAILSTLKDPDSAQFQNIKGYCGEVNSKNSYGGYSICNNLGSTLHSK